MHQIRLETFRINVISMTLAFFVSFGSGGLNQSRLKIAAVLPALKVFLVPRASVAYVRAFSQEAARHLGKITSDRRICRNPRRNAVTFQPAIYNQSRTKRPKIFFSCTMSALSFLPLFLHWLDAAFFTLVSSSTESPRRPTANLLICLHTENEKNK